MTAEVENAFVRKTAESVAEEVRKAVVGQDEVIEQVLVALISGGHVLLEGVPGVAKTLIVRALALAFDLDFKRVQFTPDMMPSDVVGTNVFDATASAFHLNKGPIFTSILLADEINRTPPKTQAALLEAMQERAVTIDGMSYELPRPFMVLATQNPIEYEGTYPLPEAELDRFMMKVVVGYPSAEQETEILRRFSEGFRSDDLEAAGIAAVASAESLSDCERAAAAVKVDDGIRDYVRRIAERTRQDRNLILGASPRAAIALLLTSQTLAAMRGRDFVIPDDVKMLAAPVLRHRLILRPEAEIEGVTSDQVISNLLSSLEVPR